ncbi:MAG: hypothetical protein HPY87_08930 [Fervidobacterium sp.]|uniref:hypothetical protein n=1 Tax=Fervidobacterium sp. TaxID=1871331 RepID=UPI0025B7DCDC|nr:hypothetical protein [Fervidobacterium sp.]NPU89984.1 hypothetical protein [Fervidobacterium sp.]
MARASVYTALSLDRYAAILGINPVHFSMGNQIQLSSGKVLFDIQNSQNNIWPQYSWQNADQISRESLANELSIAEQEVERFLGYNVCPKWTVGEIAEYSYIFDKMQSYSPENITYLDRGINTKRAKIISGGQRANIIVEENVTVDYDDKDGDGWDEIGIISVDISDTMGDVHDYRIYFSGTNADDIYEIRYPKSMTISGNTLTVVFNSWQLINYELQEMLPSNDDSEKYIDLSDSSVFVSTVDVYYVINNTADNHVEFVYSDRDSGDEVICGGYIVVTKPMRNFVVPFSAEYNTLTGNWEQKSCNCFRVDYLRLYYYSGAINMSSKTNDLLPDVFAKAIAYIATARLERVFEGNNNAESLAMNLMEDLSLRNSGNVLWAKDITECPFGTHRGEVLAYRLLKQIRENTPNVAVI